MPRGFRHECLSRFPDPDGPSSVAGRPGNLTVSQLVLRATRAGFRFPPAITKCQTVIRVVVPSNKL